MLDAVGRYYAFAAPLMQWDFIKSLQDNEEAAETAFQAMWSCKEVSMCHFCLTDGNHGQLVIILRSPFQPKLHAAHASCTQMVAGHRNDAVELFHCQLQCSVHTYTCSVPIAIWSAGLNNAFMVNSYQPAIPQPQIQHTLINVL
eukprot:GHRR01029576.1.p2 GENE.GHRR01029576.1~~GHRR01029576.1.p2  ORF type:complete len:144 (+),score=22.09 GHRR01029576.1:1106-1537(+)